jgi:peptide/nickel transport system ATP-binding protein
VSLLDVSGLDLAIRGAPILRGVAMALGPGEVLGVIGESGSGKSLTALAVMGLLPHGAEARGSIRLDGAELLERSEAEMCGLRGHDMGMIFQEPMTALNPLRTIGDQVAETVLVHARATRREAFSIAREMLDRVGLPEDRFPLDRFPHDLSGGQRQRVVIAQAIALRPRLLIADEPTTALDVTTQAQILDLLKQLVREEDMGLMLITHDLAVVAGLADSIAIMKDGAVVEAGHTREIFRAMRHPYTQALFSASAHVPERGRKPEPGTTPVLAVENVVRDYQQPRRNPFFGPREMFRAVKGVSFMLRRGESLGLVGESGCGKSTLTPRDPRSRRAPGRRGADRRRGGPCGRDRAAPSARADAGGVPGPVRQLQPAPPGRAAGDRAVPSARRSAQRRRAGGRDRDRADGCGPGGGRRRQVHPRVSRAGSASASPSPAR